MRGVLAEYGFQPFVQDGVIRLQNCPFHALSRDYRETVCGMNLSLMDGLVKGLDGVRLRAVLAPEPGFCCVRFESDTRAGISERRSHVRSLLSQSVRLPSRQTPRE